MIFGKGYILIIWVWHLIFLTFFFSIWHNLCCIGLAMYHVLRSSDNFIPFRALRMSKIYYFGELSKLKLSNISIFEPKLNLNFQSLDFLKCRQESKFDFLRRMIWGLRIGSRFKWVKMSLNIVVTVRNIIQYQRRDFRSKQMYTFNRWSWNPAEKSVILRESSLKR